MIEPSDLPTTTSAIEIHGSTSGARFILHPLFVPFTNYIHICFFEVIETIGKCKGSCIDFNLISFPPYCLHLRTVSHVEWHVAGVTCQAQHRASPELGLLWICSLFGEGGLDSECLDCILPKSPQPLLSKSISVVKSGGRGQGGGCSEPLWNNIAYYYHLFF